MHFFSIKSLFFTFLDYPVSYIEFIATCSGIVAVYLAAKSNILTWPIGLINISLSFIVFWQVHLYSDVFLQIYFFAISVYGWYNWQIEKKTEIPIKKMNLKKKVYYLSFILLLTMVFGYAMSNIHLYLPIIFDKPAAYPYPDTFIAIASIFANIWLAKRFLENWMLWIMINIVSVIIYFNKGIIIIALQFFIFLLLAILGHLKWKKELFKLKKIA
ncbi:MAG: nicotinamide mononucleotide transporter [Saprospiraceae bacterium]|nr:nicotinamide mononucleotide transporter [Saprospiraceae bacterium]